MDIDRLAILKGSAPPNPTSQVRFDDTGDDGDQKTLVAEREAARWEPTQAFEADDASRRIRSAFLANMSHELRTPLHGIIGVVSALAKTCLDDRQREMLEVISSSSKSLEGSLSAIMDISMIGAGQLTLTKTPFDLAGDVVDVCEQLRDSALTKALALTVRIDPSARGTYLGDSGRVRQVITNLLANAVKFTDRGGIGVDLQLDSQGRIEIEISDSGPGFSRETAERLFERFEQADASVTRRHGGVGLGLPIARELARLMGGELTASSELGKGSRFRVLLPLDRVEGARPACGAPPVAEPEEQSLEVLVVEDHPTNRRVVEMMLQPFDFNLSFAENGADAVEACRSRAYDIVLMDMQMPVMDGVTAVRHIRARETRCGTVRTPIAMLSANVSEDIRRAAAVAGADAYIAKPATIESLLGGITAALDSAQAAAMRGDYRAAG